MTDICNPEEACPITELRAAIQANQVNFPVPVPVFAAQYRSDIQWRLAELFFVHGWSPLRLAERYGISASRVRQSLRSWVRRAKTMGYLQPVPAAEDIRPALVLSAAAGSAAGFAGAVDEVHVTGLMPAVKRSLQRHA